MWKALTGAACCILLACGSADTGRPAASPTVTVPPEAAPLVAQAQADAATRTSIPANAWTVVVVQPKEWPDASLGCPKPGVMYIQVVTRGYLIILSSGGRTLEYHASATSVAYCSG